MEVLQRSCPEHRHSQPKLIGPWFDAFFPLIVSLLAPLTFMQQKIAVTKISRRSKILLSPSVTKAGESRPALRVFLIASPPDSNDMGAFSDTVSDSKTRSWSQKELSRITSSSLSNLKMP
jgi:hypothetical protein